MATVALSLTMSRRDVRKTARRVKVGAVTGQIAGTQTGQLSVKLTKRGRRLLRRSRRHRLKVRASGTSTNRAGGATPVSRRLTVKRKRR